MKITENFTYIGTQQNFERDSYATLAEMKAVIDKRMPDIFTATCKETGKFYIYNKNNEVDETLGKWRELSIDSDDYVTKTYLDTEIAKKADITSIPSKVSDLENDSNFISSIPAEYVTEAELSAKGYLTEHQDLSAYATKDEIPTIPSKVSELTNDSNYQTAEQISSTVTAEIAKVVANAPENFDTLKEMSDWIAGHENDASTMNSAISDSKTAITALQSGKADKSEIPTTVAQLTDSDDYAKKTDIPTTLPANGGNANTVNNHTVESNVPADAVFTDTTYESVTQTEDGLMSAADKVKLDGMEEGANKTLIDIELSSTSTNPVQNKIVTDALNNKADKSKYSDTTINIGRKASTTVGVCSTAEGYNTTASNYCSHAEGLDTTASGTGSHAEGHSTTASGVCSHAEGRYTTASGSYSHAEGSNYNTSGDTLPDRTATVSDVSYTISGSTAYGKNSHAEGTQSFAYAYSSHAEGYGTTASGIDSHAEGYGTTASGDYSHAEGYRTTASEAGSHAEGVNTTASGVYSHAEGHNTTANRENSHAEGLDTTASGDCSHAEGLATTASGDFSHAEGGMTTANGNNSHAEGSNTIANGESQHVQGKYNIADETSAFIIGNGSSDNARSNAMKVDWNGNLEVAGNLKDGSGNTLNNMMSKTNPTGTGSFSLNRKASTTIGTNSTAEGSNTTASGNSSHAEGSATTASGDYSHAEGSNYNSSNETLPDRTTKVSDVSYTISGSTAYGINSHAEGTQSFAYAYSSHTEGYKTTASGDSSHAEGYQTTASGANSHAEGYRAAASGTYSHAEGSVTKASGTYCSHAEGSYTTASGSYSHAEGYQTTASGNFGSHAEGNTTTASGANSHAEGFDVTASGDSSHAEGYRTTASGESSHACGHYNAAMTDGGASNNTTGTAFVIGNGTKSTALSNAFSVQFDGTVKAKSTITASTTADYAEFFEWLDKNPNEEDRVGHFVTLDGDKIKIATSEDDYILGIVSGEPFVLGNGDCDTWNGMYLHDEFRRTIYEPAPKMIEILDSEGNPTGEYKEVEGEYEGTRPVLNPDYDQTKQYISRFDRAEWSPIGMLGVLAVLHDGTAEVNGYVTVNDEGIATKCTRDIRNSYRVIKKVSDKVVEVIFR